MSEPKGIWLLVWPVVAWAFGLVLGAVLCTLIVVTRGKVMRPRDAERCGLVVALVVLFWLCFREVADHFMFGDGLTAQLWPWIWTSFFSAGGTLGYKLWARVLRRPIVYDRGRVE